MLDTLPAAIRGAVRRALRKHLLVQSLSVVCLAAMAVSALYIGAYYYRAYNQRNLTNAVRELYTALEPVTLTPAALAVAATPPPDPAEDGSDPAETPTATPYVPPNAARLSSFTDINPDFAAMLVIPGLDMVLPVVQGTDNAAYLQINFEGASDPHGTVFLDYKNNNNFSDKNNVLYGHYMNDGTMFHDLFKYKTIENYAKAPLIEVESLHGMTTWLVFAAYTSEPAYGYFHTGFYENGFEALITEAERRSLFLTDVEVAPDDKLLTLSTCDYDFENARFVVHARLLREGEKLPYVYRAEPNPDRQPYNVPDQLRFTSVAADGLGVMQHPRTNFVYFYQRGESGIDRYVGNFSRLQGPYAAYAGAVNPALASWTAAGVSGSQFYLVSGGLDGDTKGLFVLRAASATGPYAPLSKKPVTPEGQDARWPVLYTDGAGRVTLLYTVTDETDETLYALALRDGQPPVLVTRAAAGTDIRPVGIIEHETAGFLVFWKEGNRLRTASRELTYPEEEGRLQFVRQRSPRRWMAVTEHNGKVKAAPLDIAALLSEPGH